MADDDERRTLSESAARQLANATKTRAQWGGITPRWLVNFLAWTPVEAGIFRLNRVKEEGGEPTDVECSPPAIPICRRLSSITSIVLANISSRQ
jgi:hypothetical protein